MSSTLSLPSTTKSAVSLGTRLEPFIDGWLLEQLTNLSLKLAEPVKREIVFTTDALWETMTSGYFVIFQDGGLVRLYYRGYNELNAPDEAPRQATCYAESTDGVHFTRPNLGLREFHGSTANNILLMGPEAHNFAPFLDTNPAAKAEVRYKAVGGVANGLYAFGSPDGIHWKRLQAEPVITRGQLDSLNIPFWDEAAGVYRCYSRYFDASAPGEPIRSIWSQTSPDFLHWSEPHPNQYSEDIAREHFYTNATIPHPGAPHLLLSFPMRFQPERQKLPEHPATGTSDAVLMSSRDGVHWDRTFPQAWVRPGRDLQNWTDRCNMPARGIIQTTPDEYSLYLTEHYRWPSHGLRRYTVRRDGFASIHAGYLRGECLTRPLILTNERQLILNFSTSAVGQLQAEIQDEAGHPIPGYRLDEMEPIYGDDLDSVVRWNSGDDLTPLHGRTVRLRFVMREADLFSIRFAPLASFR